MVTVPNGARFQSITTKTAPLETPSSRSCLPVYEASPSIFFSMNYLVVGSLGSRRGEVRLGLPVLHHQRHCEWFTCHHDQSSILSRSADVSMRFHRWTLRREGWDHGLPAFSRGLYLSHKTASSALRCCGQLQSFLCGHSTVGLKKATFTVLP